MLTLAGIGQASACADPQRTEALLARLAQRAGVSTAGLFKHRRHGNGSVKTAYRLPGPAVCQDGKADIFDCDNMALLGHLTLTEIGGGDGTDSWGWRDPQTGRYYALVGRTNGTAFVDITEPTAPIYLGNLPTETEPSRWRDIKTYRHYALVVADELVGHGVQVFDLTRLRGLDGAPPRTFDADAVYHDLDDAHNIAVNETAGFAYAVGGKSCDGGLHMIDVRDPLAPVFAGCFDADGYTHDTQCVIYLGPDADYRGREVCFASNEDTLTLVDVSEKNNPRQISRSGYPDAGYTHQGWLTDDQRYFLVDDEFDEARLHSHTRTLVWDVADLDAPRLVGVHLGSGQATDHNQYVSGDYVYQANYTRGLRVLKIDDLATARLTEVAYFDSYPEADNFGYNGAWNIYPFFDNGLVLINDTDRGLFIVRPQLGGGLLPEELFDDNFEAAAGAGFRVPAYAAALPICRYDKP